MWQSDDRIAVLEYETRLSPPYKNVELYPLDEYVLVSGLVETEVAVCIRLCSRFVDCADFRVD